MAPENSAILAAIYDPQTGLWETPTTLSVCTTATDPRISAIVNGIDFSVVVTWTEICEEKTRLYAAMRPGQLSDWTSSVKISQNDEDVQSQRFLKINAEGKIIATWSSVDSLGALNSCSSTSVIGTDNAWTVPKLIPGL